MRSPTSEPRGKNKKQKRRTVTVRIPGLEPSDGSSRKRRNGRKEGRTANGRRDGIRHDFIAPSVLHAPNAFGGDVETPWEGQVPVRMTTRDFNPAEEVLRDLTGYRFIVWCEWDIRPDATKQDLGDRKGKGERGSASPFSSRLNHITTSVDRSDPHPTHRVPREPTLPNRTDEPPTLAFLVPESVVNDLPIESPVREIRPGDEGRVRDVGGGGVSQSPLVAVGEVGPVGESTVVDEEPFFPAGAVVSDLERVDANLGFEEGSGSEAVGKRDGVVARTVLVDGRVMSMRRDAFRRCQGEERGEEET